MRLSRRQLLLTTLSGMLLSHWPLVHSTSIEKLNWIDFQLQMVQLSLIANRNILEQSLLENKSIALLKQLDIKSDTFKQAVEQSYESGNRYWLWQRLIKLDNLNGGILNIDQSQIVQLHDHPGATGIVRIISGSAEVWLFDEDKKQTGNGQSKLNRVSRKILQVGDTAVLSPDKGNIHALRAISKECSMLDFFIPPYKRSQRSWYEPLSDNWVDQQSIRCRKISQDEYSLA